MLAANFLTVFFATLALNSLSYPTSKLLNSLQNSDLKSAILRNLNEDYVSVSSLHSKSLTSEIECYMCKLVVESLHVLWSSDVTQDCIADIVTEVCIILKIQDNHICHMMIGDEKDEVLYVIGQTVVEPNQLCGLLLDDCGKYVNPNDPNLANWTIPLPPNKPPVEKLTQPEIGTKPTLRVLHLTDIHFDPKYMVGSEAKCTEPQCCRSMPSDGTPPKEAAGQWGSLGGNCDAPVWVVENAFDHISKTEKIDLIYWTGDLPPHADWEYTRPSHIAMLQNLTQLFLNYFPGVPAYWAVGNHEGVPIDSFPPHYVPDQYSSAWLYDSLAGLWGHWLPEETIPVIKWRASYMVKPFPGFRVISLNTIYGYNTNFWLYINQTDPDGTLAWFAEELYKAEQAGDKVHVIGHIPGDGGFHGFGNNFYDIINRFENTVRGQFFGHSHHDQFHMMYENADYTQRVTGVKFVAPSITTYGGINPAYRIYTVDGNYDQSTWTVLDHETHYMDVNKSNFLNSPQWKKEYTARDAYKMDSLLPADWNDLINRMETDVTLFDKYRWFTGRHAPSGTCDDSCRHSTLCGMRRSRQNNGKLCPPPPKSTAEEDIVLRTWRLPVQMLKKPVVLDKCPISLG